MASVVVRHAPCRLPELPALAWAVVARAALHAEDDDVRTWARLSLVNSTWRAALRGVAYTCSEADSATCDVPFVRLSPSFCAKL
jgi:hypothetical protein